MKVFAKARRILRSCKRPSLHVTQLALRLGQHLRHGGEVRGVACFLILNLIGASEARVPRHLSLRSLNMIAMTERAQASIQQSRDGLPD